MSCQDCLPPPNEFDLDMQGEFRASSKNFIVGAHPHGVFSFCGVCAAVLNPETLFRVWVTATTEPAEPGGQVMTHGAPDGFGAALPQAFAQSSPWGASSGSHVYSSWSSSTLRSLSLLRLLFIWWVTIDVNLRRTLMEEWLVGTGIADTLGPLSLCLQEAPTAAASVTKLFPILKDVLAIFGLIDPWKRN